MSHRLCLPEKVQVSPPIESRPFSGNGTTLTGWYCPNSAAAQQGDQGTRTPQAEEPFLLEAVPTCVTSALVCAAMVPGVDGDVNTAVRLREQTQPGLAHGRASQKLARRRSRERRGRRCHPRGGGGADIPGGQGQLFQSRTG